MNISEEWIEWTGGSCPVDPEQDIVVVISNVSPAMMSKASTFLWERSNDWHRIVAYRLPKPGEFL